MQRAFVIRPFGKKKDAGGKDIDFDQIHKDLIDPALHKAGLAGSTTGEIIDSGNIREDMFSLIIEADLVICDITIHNANVFYELGIRQALRRKRTILIKGRPVADATPFDILTDRYLDYQIDQPGEWSDELVDMIKATLNSERPTDSPIFKMLPSLNEVDLSAMSVMPQELAEEIGRATAGRSRGWLRLLAEEVGGQRFQWPALRQIAQSQQGLKDYGEAIATWEKVRKNNPGDVEANLALANLFEKTCLTTRNPQDLTASDQAITRVLTSSQTSPGQRAEALALCGRNLKTRWRREFDQTGEAGEPVLDLPGRRERAISRKLLEAYALYYEAFLIDLNHYWSGLAALQMGTVALDLTAEPSWEYAFDSTLEAERRKENLQRELATLREAVTLSCRAAMGRPGLCPQDYMWANVTVADLMFLNGEPLGRLKRAYRNAIPDDDYFTLDSVQNQLQLFELVGFRSQEARALVDYLEPDRRNVQKKGAIFPLVFVGHRVDQPGRTPPRFPADKEAEAHRLIERTLRALKQRVQSEHEGQLRGFQMLASAAPGADILCHEICRELEIESVICLPMPSQAYVSAVFDDTNSNWRERFRKLVNGGKGSVKVLELNNSATGLPRWLAGTPIDPWERGNKWVLKMAQSAPLGQAVVAFWDQNLTADAPGGTAHMVQLARDAGILDLTIIDTAELFRPPQAGSDTVA